MPQAPKVAFLALLATLPAAEGLALSGPGSRRQALLEGLTTGIGIGLGSQVLPSLAKAEPASGAIVVLGANGKTGRAVLRYAGSKGLPVTAGTRSGLAPSGLDVAAVEADVKDLAKLRAAVKGAAAVVFAASASRTKEFAKVDDARAVDYEGVVNTAKACIEAKVPRLVIVSSGGVSKPDSAVFKFLNLFGKIMEYKFMGEEAVRQLYAAEKNDGLSYTIVRPGGLTEETPLGVSGVALGQGDLLSGRISRDDVAAICVEAVSRKSAADVTIECFNKDSSQPLDAGIVNNIFKGGASKEPIMSEQRVGSTWDEIFNGLKTDA